MLIPRAAQGTRTLTEGLEQAKIDFFDVPVYDTIYRSDASEEVKALLGRGEPVTVTFTSASTVRGFVHSLEGTDLSGVRGLCIGEQTAALAREFSLAVQVAREAAIDAMVEALLEGR